MGTAIIQYRDHIPGNRIITINLDMKNLKRRDNMEHTPGPFYNNGPFICSNIKDIDGNIRNTTIAEIVFHRTGGNPEDHANVNLFKAAPDLLEACKVAIQYKAEADGMNTIIPVSRALVIIETAIAKAEGK